MLPRSGPTDSRSSRSRCCRAAGPTSRRRSTARSCSRLGEKPGHLLARHHGARQRPVRRVLRVGRRHAVHADVLGRRGRRVVTRDGRRAGRTADGQLAWPPVHAGRGDRQQHHPRARRRPVGRRADDAARVRGPERATAGPSRARSSTGSRWCSSTRRRRCITASRRSASSTSSRSSTTAASTCSSPEPTRRSAS